MKNSKDIYKVLNILHNARQQLIMRTLNESPDLFQGFFSFENNEAALQLIFEKEIINFVNFHLCLIGDVVNNKDEYLIYKNAIKNLVYKLNVSSGDRADGNLFIELLSAKTSIINALLDIEVNSEDAVSKTKYLISKHNRLFEREFLKFKNEM